ncbi:lipoprotein 17-related variable surface protein [Mycoplasmopsis sturni]|uniref:lipoprotein 17-related variable surface protein n=1 Tax=Mycoplasmopsis sturni TaxID=39047 RepID=UPI00055C9C81|nr:lipoprotein 17-related variable surface protein [Mycoplasmopsis sturni]
MNRKTKLALGISTLTVGSLVTFATSTMSHEDRNWIADFIRDHTFSAVVHEKNIVKQYIPYLNNGEYITQSQRSEYIKYSSEGSTQTDNDNVDKSVKVRLVDGDLEDQIQTWEVTFNAQETIPGTYESDPYLTVFLSNDLEIIDDTNEGIKLDYFAGPENNPSVRKINDQPILIRPNEMGYGLNSVTLNNINKDPNKIEYLDEPYFMYSPSVGNDSSYPISTQTQLDEYIERQRNTILNRGGRSEDVSKAINIGGLWNTQENHEPRFGQGDFWPYIGSVFSFRYLNTHERNKIIKFTFKTKKNFTSPQRATDPSHPAEGNRLKTFINEPFFLDEGQTFVGGAFGNGWENDPSRVSMFTKARTNNTKYKIIIDESITNNSTDNKQIALPDVNYAIVAPNEKRINWNSGRSNVALDSRTNNQNPNRLVMYEFNQSTDFLRYINDLKLEASFPDAENVNRWKIKIDSNSYKLDSINKILYFKINYEKIPYVLSDLYLDAFRDYSNRFLNDIQSNWAPLNDLSKEDRDIVLQQKNALSKLIYGLYEVYSSKEFENIRKFDPNINDKAKARAAILYWFILRNFLVPFRQDNYINIVTNDFLMGLYKANKMFQELNDGIVSTFNEDIQNYNKLVDKDLANTLTIREIDDLKASIEGHFNTYKNKLEEYIGFDSTKLKPAYDKTKQNLSKYYNDKLLKYADVQGASGTPSNNELFLNVRNINFINYSKVTTSNKPVREFSNEILNDNEFKLGYDKFIKKINELFYEYYANNGHMNNLTLYPNLTFNSESTRQSNYINTANLNENINFDNQGYTKIVEAFYNATTNHDAIGNYNQRSKNSKEFTTEIKNNWQQALTKLEELKRTTIIKEKQRAAQQKTVDQATIDNLPYLSKRLKEQYKAEIAKYYDFIIAHGSANNPNKLASSLVHEATQLSGTGVLSSTNGREKGFAKDIIQKRKQITEKLNTIVYAYADDQLKSNLDRVLAEVYNGPSGQNQANFTNGSNDGSRFNDASGYSDYKLDKTFTLSEYQQWIKNMDDAYDYLNGLDVQNWFTYKYLENLPSVVNGNNLGHRGNIQLYTSHSLHNPNTTTVEMAQATGSTNRRQVWQQSGTPPLMESNVIPNGWFLSFIGIYDQNDEEGTLKVKYKVESPRYIQDQASMTQEQKNKYQQQHPLQVREAIISGFWSQRRERERIAQMQVVSVSYENQDFLLSSKASGGMDPNKLTFVVTDPANDPNRQFTIRYDTRTGKYTSNDLKLEIKNINFAQITNANDINGRLNVTYTLASTQNLAAHSGEHNTDKSPETKQLSNTFKTEKERLDKILSVMPSINTLLDQKNGTNNPRTKLASVGKNDIEALINEWLSQTNKTNLEWASSIQNEVQVDSASLNKGTINDTNGTISNYRFKFKSLRNGLTTVRSDQKTESSITGFYTANSEKQRLDEIANQLVSGLKFDYQNKSGIIPYNKSNYPDQNGQTAIPQAHRLAIEHLLLEGWTWNRDKTALENNSLKVKILKSDITIDNQNAANGTIRVNFKISSTDSRFTRNNIKSDTKNQSISNFKTEKQRLIEVLNNLKANFNTTLYTNEQKDKLTAFEGFKEVGTQAASVPNDLMFVNRLTAVLSQSHANYDASSLEKSTDKNDFANGKMAGIKFDINSNIPGLESIKTTKSESFTSPVEITGFWTWDKEAQRLLTIQTNFDYEGKANTIPYNATDLRIDKLILNNATKQNNSGTITFVNSDQKWNVNTISITEVNPNGNGSSHSGKIKLTYRVQSTSDQQLNYDSPSTSVPHKYLREAYYTYPLWNEQNHSRVFVEGFKTEKDRLNELVVSTTVDSILRSNNTYSQMGASQAKNQIQSILNAHFNKSPYFAEVATINILNSNVNNRDGIISNVTYTLKSTKTGLNNVISNPSVSENLQTFITEEQEKTRLENEVKNSIVFDYINKSLYVPYNDSQLDRNHLTLGNNWVSNNDGTWTSQNLKAKVTFVSFNTQNFNPTTGTAEVVYTISSLNSGFENLSTDQLNNTIAGFKTEQQRLDDLIRNETSSLPKLNELYSQDSKNKLASEAANQLQNLVNQKITQKGNLNASVYDLQKTPNNNQGQILDISYKLESTKVKGVYSNLRTNKGTISGFKTNDQIQQDLTNASTGIYAILDYQGKSNIIPYQNAQLDVSQLKKSLTDNQWIFNSRDNTYSKDNFKLQITGFDSKNPTSGSTDVLYTISSTQPGFENQSQNHRKSINNFKTEEQRLNELITNLSSRHIVQNLAIANKNTKLPSEVSEQDIKNLLQNQLQSNDQAIVSDVSLVPNLNNGSLEVTYRLTSKLVPSVRSSLDNTSDKNISGFKTEAQRLNELNIQFNYTNKQNIVPYNNAAAPFSGLTLASDWVKGKDGNYTSQSNQAKISNLRIINWDPRTGKITLDYTINSTKNGYTNITSNAASKVGRNEVTGFQTEQQRLQHLVDSLNNLQNQFTSEDLDQDAQSGKEKLQGKINNLLNGHNAQFASLNQADVNNQNGTISNIKFTIKSTISDPNLTNITAQNTRSQSLSGFNTQTKEKQRLSQLVPAIQFGYTNKENQIPYQVSNLDKNQLTLPQGWIKSSDGQSWENSAKKAKITNIHFNSTDPVSGTVQVTYDLQSTKDNFTNTKLNNTQSQRINGFDTEVKRLDRIIANVSDLPQLNDLFNEEEKKALASTIDNQKLVAKINAKLQQKGFEAQVHDLSFTVNDTNGTLENVSYKLVSTKIPNQSNPITSTTRTNNATISGFNNNSLEQQRINNLANLIKWDYQNKATTIPYQASSLDKSNAHLKVADSLKDQGWSTTDNGTTWISNQKEAKISNIRLEQANAKDGSVKVLFDLQSTRAGFTSIKKANQEDAVNSFKTEKQRLNALITNSQSLPNLDSLFANKADISAQSAALMLENKLNEKLQSNHAKAKDLSYQVDNANGQITQIRYKLQSTISQSDVSLEDVISDNTTNNDQISGFKTEAQVHDELRAQVVNLDYKDKDSIIPYLESQLTLENVLVTQGWTKVQDQANIYDKEHARLTLKTIENKNPIDGSIQVTYTLNSTRDHFKNVSEQLNKTITGFDTEQKRLDRKLNELGQSKTIENLFSAQEKLKAPSEVQKEEVAKKLNDLLKNDSMQVLVNDIVLSAHDQSGTLDVKYKLSSTKVNASGATVIKSSRQNSDSDKTISHFWTLENERNRLNDLSNNLQFDFGGKEQIIPYEKNQSNLDLNNLTIAGFTKQIDPTTQKPYWVSDSNQAKITDVAISTVDAQSGNIQLQYTLTSTKNGYESALVEIQPSEQTKIGGFNTEINRLNELLNSFNNLNTLTFKNGKKLFDEAELDQKASANKDQLIEKLNHWLDENHENAEIDRQSLTDTADDANGSLNNISFKLQSKVNNWTNVKSSQIKSGLEITGFNSPSKEQSRLDSLANQIQWDYQGKHDHVYYNKEQLQENALESKLVEQGWIKQTDGTYRNENQKAKLIVTSFVSTDPINGITKLNFEITSTKIGFESIKTNAKEATIVGFKTEQERLNDLITNNDGLPNLNTLFDGEDKKDTASANKAKLIEKINAWLSTNHKDAQVTDLQATSNDENGQITGITYKLKSTKVQNGQNLVTSTEVKNNSDLTGFNTSTSEQSRINDIANQITWDYENKNNVIPYETTNLEKSNLESELTKQGWVKSEDGTTWSNVEKAAILSDISFSSTNAKDGHVTISFKVNSTREHFKDIQTNHSTNIAGFRTEKDRLNDLIKNTSNSDLPNLNDLTRDLKERNAEFAKNQLKEKINAWLRDHNKGAEVGGEIVAEFNNQSGEITNISYKLKSTKTNYQDVASSETTTPTTITGFKTPDQVKQELNEVNEQIKQYLDYENKDQIVPYLDLTLEKDKLAKSLTEHGWTNNGNGTFTSGNAQLTINDFSNQDAQNGSAQISYTIRSTRPDFSDNESIKVEDHKVIDNFKNEKSHLNDIIKQLNNDDTIKKLLDNDSLKDDVPNKVTAQQIAEKLNQTLKEKGISDVVVQAEDITLNANKDAGTLNVIYQVESTKVTDPKIKSDTNEQVATSHSTKADNQISGFFTPEQERQRLESLQVDFNYNNKNTIVPYETSLLNPTDLELGLGWTKVEDNGVIKFRNQDQKAEISGIEFKNADPITGQVQLKYTISSLKDSYTAVNATIEPTSDNFIKNTISGFKTEEQRLNEIIRELNNLDDLNLFDATEKDKKASSNQSSLEAKLNKWLQENNKNAIISNLQVEVDDTNGKLVIQSAHLQSKVDQYQSNTKLNAVQSSEAISNKEITRFNTEAKERARLTELSQNLSQRSIFDYQNKANIIPYQTSDLDLSHLTSTDSSWIKNDSNLNTNFVNRAENSKINNLAFANLDAKNGNVNVNYTLNSTKEGFENVSVEVPFVNQNISQTITSPTINGFKNEKDRLNEIKNAIPSLESLFSQNEKDLKSENAASQIQEKINQWLREHKSINNQANEAQVADLSYSFNDPDDGTIKEITFNLKSTKAGYEDQKSDTSNTQNIGGFRTNQQERQRLEELAKTIKWAYEGASAIVPYTNTTLDVSNFKKALEENGWTYNSIDQSYSKASTKLSDIAFKRQNEDSTQFDNDPIHGTTKITFILTSQKTGFESISNSHNESLVEGFKTEAQRLDELINIFNNASEKENSTLPILQNLFNEQERQSRASTNNAHLEEKINKWLAENHKDAKVYELQNTGTYENHGEMVQRVDNGNGTISHITYKLQSTKEGLNTVYSTLQTNPEDITGFRTPSNEGTRLSNIINNFEFNYDNKQSLIPYQDSNLSLDKIVLPSGWEKQGDNWVNNNEDVKAKITNLRFSEADPVSGKVKVLFDIESLFEEFQDTKLSGETKTISEFKTERQRLDEIVQGTSKDVALPIIDGTNNDQSIIKATNKERIASQFTKEELQRRLQDFFDKNLNAQVQVVDLSLNYDDATGEIQDLKYKLKSKHEHVFEEVKTADFTTPVTSNGFITTTKVQKELDDAKNQLLAILDYQGKGSIIPYQDETLHKTHLEESLTNDGWAKQEDGTFTKEHLKLTLDNFINNDPIQGKTNINFTITSTRDDFKDKLDIKAQATKEINGFKTEAQRLNEVILDLQNNNVLENLLNNKDRLPSTISKEEIAARLNEELLKLSDHKGQNMTIKADDVILNSNNETGVLKVNYQITSTKVVNPKVKSTTSSTLANENTAKNKIIGFTTPAQEQARVNAFVVKSIAYTDSNNIQLAYPQIKTLDPSKVIITLTKDDQDYISDAYGIFRALNDSQSNPQLKVENLSFDSITNANDANGSLLINFDLATTKEGYTGTVVGVEGIKSTHNSQNLSGFKTEITRLDEVLSTKSAQLSSLDIKNKHRSASQVTDLEIQNLINQILQGSDSHLPNLGSDFVVTKNDQNGRITVEFKIQSTRAQLSEQKSKSTQKLNFDGFVTNEQEINRLNNNISIVNIQAKNAASRMLQFDNVNPQQLKEELTITLNENVNGITKVIEGTWDVNKQAYVFDALDVQIKKDDITFDPITNANDRNGQLQSKVKLSSTIAGINAKSEDKTNTLVGFKTEAQRLNEVINSVELTKNGKALDFENKNRSSSTVTKNELTNLLDPLYTSNQATVENNLNTGSNIRVLQALAGEGTLSAQYVIQSTRKGLQDITSGDTHHFASSGFVKANDEVSRLEALLAKALVQYQDKETQPTATHFDPSKVSITIDGVIGRYQPEKQSFVFDEPISAIAQGITFVNQNDINGTVNVIIGKLKSNILGLENHQTSAESAKVTQVDGFATEEDRLSALVTQAQQTDQQIAQVYLQPEINKNTKLPSQIKKEDFVAQLDSQEKFLLDWDSALFEANDKLGTLKVEVLFKTDKTIEELNFDPHAENKNLKANVKSTNKLVILNEGGFKTSYQKALDELNKYGVTSPVVVTYALNNQIQTLASDNDAQNVQNYNFLLQNLDSHYQIIYQSILGFDELTGRTLVGYQIQDNNIDHEDANHQKPISKFYYAIVEGFQTESQRLDALQMIVKEALINPSEHQKTSLLPTDVQNDSFIFDQQVEASNKVRGRVKRDIIEKNNQNGTIEVPYDYDTAKTQDELYRVNLPSENSETANVLRQMNFERPTNWEVLKNDEANYSGYLTNRQDLINKINDVKESIDQKQYLSEDEKNHFKKQLDDVLSNYDQTSTQNDQTRYEQAKNEIYSISNKAGQTDNDKQSASSRIDQLNNLNDVQKQYYKDQIKQSNHQKINNSSNPLTNTIEQQAQDLDAAMKVLKDKTDLKDPQNEQNAYDQSEEFNNAPEELKNLFQKATEAAKKVTNVTSPSSSLEGIADEIWGNVAKPTQSEDSTGANWTKEQVDNLAQIIEHTKEAIKAHNDKLQQVIGDINAKENLSQQEKEVLTKQAKEATSISSLDNINNEANAIDANKKSIIDQVGQNYVNLNDSQKETIKQAVKDAILENTLIAQEALNSKVQDQSPAKVEQVQTQANNLNDSMKTLKDYADNSDLIKTNPKTYGDASQASKEVYDKLIQAAQELEQNTNPANSNLPGWDNNVTSPSDASWNKAQVDQLNQLIKNALQTLAKEAHQRQDLINSIDQMAYLAKAEQDALKEKAQNATSIDEFNNLKEQANSINNEKGNLINNVVQTYPNLNKDQVKEVKQAIKNAILDTQTSAIKDQLTDQEKVSKVNQDAQMLNEAMKKLTNKVAQAEQAHLESDYSNSSSSLQKAYDDAILAAKDLANNKSQVDKIKNTWNTNNANLPINSNDQVNLDQTNVNNSAAWTKEQVEELQRLIDQAKDKLSEFAKAKQATNDSLNQAQFLSQDEKESFEEQLNQAQTVEQINTIKARIEQVNQAKEKLVNEVLAHVSENSQVKFPHLNEDQRNRIREEIISSVFDENDLTQNVKAKHPDALTSSQVQNQAHELDVSMEYLKALTEDNFINSDSFNKAILEDKQFYQDAIDSANKLANNKSYLSESIAKVWDNNEALKPDYSNDDNSNHAAQWDKKQVEELIQIIENQKNKINDFAQKVDKAKESINNNKYLSKEEQAKLLDNIKQAKTADEVVEQQKISEQIEQIKKPLVNSVEQNFKYLNEDQKELLKQAIKDSLTSQTLISDDLHKASPELTTPEQVINQAKKLDKSMQENQDLIAQEQEIKESQAYNQISKEIQNAYEHALNVAKDLHKNISDITSNDHNLELIWNQNNAPKPKDQNEALAAGWNKAQVDELNRIIKDTINKVIEQNNKINNLKDQIDQLEYLSKEEKDKFKDALTKTANEKQVSEIFNQAKNDNQTKKELVDKINQLTHLNDDQKHYFKEQIISNALEDQKSQSQIQDEANELDYKMDELSKTQDDAQKLKNTLAYHNASQETRNAFEKAIQDALDTLNNRPINGNQDANLNKEQVQELIDQIKLKQNQTINDIVDHLDGLIDNEKPVIKDHIHNQNNLDEKINALEKVKDISDSINQLIEKEKQYFNNNDPKLVSQIESIIKHLNDLNVQTDNFVKTKKAIQQLHALLDALRKYRNSDIQQKEYLEIKAKLEEELNLIELINLTQYPKLNELINQINTSLKAYQAQGQDEIGLVEDLLDLNQEDFNTLIEDLNNRGKFKKYNNLANQLNDLNYFKKIAAGRVDQKQLLKSIKDQLEQLDLSGVSNVLKSVLKQNLDELSIASENLKFLWWVFLATNSALILGIIITLAKRKK